MTPKLPDKIVVGGWLKTGAATLVEYTPLLLTIGFATYAGLATNNPKISQATLIQWMIILLGLIGTSLLAERVTRLSRIDRRVGEMAELFAAFMAQRIRSTDFFIDDRPDLQHEVESASTILVVAVNAEGFLVAHKNSIAERVREGAELRVVAVDPSSAAAGQIANPDKELTVEYLQATARISKQTLMWIDHERNGHGGVELRYCDHVPMFAAYAFDRSAPRGKIVLGLYRQFWAHVRRPHAILTKARDGYWYEYYCEQIDEIWQRASPVPLTATPAAGAIATPTLPVKRADA